MHHHHRTITATITATGTVPIAGRISRYREDRTAHVYPSPTDWCLDAAALAAFTGDDAELAAHVGDEDLWRMYGPTLSECPACGTMTTADTGAVCCYCAADGIEDARNA